ncbi:MAG: hypothetical protein QM784_30360 [Polyangiaceae bacterium]
MLALIEGNKEAYVAACKAKHSEVDVTQLMDWAHNTYEFKCKPTKLTAAPSDENYVLFRKSYNEWCKGSPAEDEIGPRGTAIGQYGRLQDDIWAAMFDLYEHNLRQELGEEAAAVQALRGKVTWVSDSKKSVGYGESHPTAKNTIDGTRSQADRRVEVFLFDEKDAPDLEATQGADVYDGVTFEKKTVEPMATARREPVVVVLRDTSDSPIVGAGVELSIADSVFGQGTTNNNGECHLKAPHLPELVLRITSIDESRLSSGTLNTEPAHFASEFEHGHLVQMSPRMVTWLTCCDLTLVVDETKVAPQQRTAVLESSDHSVLRRSALMDAENDDVAQGVTFPRLPTFGKSYKLCIESSTGSIEVFGNQTILQLLASIADARQNLVDVEPNPNKRQAALDNDATGTVTV